ncbi:ABC transporter substrate-binding protein [Acidisphaera sp. L21]|uniref:ABC transporter substrate-binding protein n=1 Tax=Acidisphaera sp. L21 TaxID=1641851 RepID=UPI00131C1FDC
MRRRTLIGGMAAILAAPHVARADDRRTLRFVPSADLAATDPIWNNAYITRLHALTVFDTLYGTATDTTVSPQMVAGHVVENDGKTWRLTLRDGLRFHDGTPVLARDCVASLRRWSKRDAFGTALFAVTDALDALDDRTLVFRLSKPFPLLPAALGKNSASVPVIMPERLSLVDAYKAVGEVVGSGPYRFVPEERLAGARAVYARNEAYIPRPDGIPSVNAGPRIANFDRLEFITIPDAATAAAALQSGSVDWLERPLTDLLPLLRRAKGVKVEVTDPNGLIGHMRFNHLTPPFNRPAVCHAVMMAVSQLECMNAIVGTDPALFNDRVGLFSPISPMASDAGLPPPGASGDLAARKRELEAAGYNGERVVVLAGTDVAINDAVSEVTAETMRRLGMNVDYAATDWGTVNQRFLSKQPVENGGWSTYCTFNDGGGLANPISYNALRATGASGLPGWPDIPEIETLRTRWLDATTLPDQKAICRDIQRVAMDQAIFTVLGQFIQPAAYRDTLTNMARGIPVFTQLRKA